MLEAIEITAELDRRQRTNRLRFYKPYAKQRQFHAAGKEFSERLFMAGNQLGKALRNGTPVATPSGWVPIEAIRVGDEVVSGDGTLTIVMGVFPQGKKPLYRLTFDVGETIDCCGEHLWKYQHPRARFPTRRSHRRTEPNPFYGEWSVGNTEEILRAVGHAPIPPRRVVIPTSKPWGLQSRSVPVDPYLLGVLLGDGCLRNGRIVVSTADQEILDSVSSVLPDGLSLKLISRYDYAITSCEDRVRDATTGQFTSSSPLMAGLIELGVYGKYAHEKVIPSEYLLNTPDARLAMLQGLMDTDGYISESGAMEFSTSSPGLRDGVKFLVHTFGGKCSVEERQTYAVTGETRKAGRISYRLRIRLNICPFRLARKAKRWAPRHNTEDRVLHRIEPIGVDYATCISVAHPEKTFVTAHGIVTHNTIGGGAEWAIHLTGRYPDWWDGAVFDKAPILWAGSVTGESTRDNPQRILVGPPAKEEEWGTGLIPADAIVDWDRALGVPNLLDNIVIRWGGGGDVQAQHSQLAFKAYEKGREKWQGPTIDGVWFDEEPPQEIYSEGLTRTNRGQRGQFAQQTFTPLKGMSEVVMRFLRPDEHDPGAKSRTVISMTIDDVEHYSAEEKAKIVASYSPHERDARSRGVPSLGAGAIYPVPWSEVIVKPFAIPEHWPRAYALDVGWNRTAALWGAKDRETGVLYVYAEHYRGQAEPSIHAEAIKARGEWIKGAIDPASRGGSQKDGEQLIATYKGLGLKLTPAINAVEAGIYQVWQALSTGRIKFFSTLQNTEHEYRIYHRDEKGRVVKENDHLMDDVRYLWMTWDQIASVKPVDRPIAPGVFISDTKAGY